MGPGGFDMQQIFAAAQQALSAQQELANSEITGTAGGGARRHIPPVLSLQRCVKIAARGDPDGKAETRREFLCHQDGVAIGDGQHAIEGTEVHDGGDELVGNALNAVTTRFASRA